MWDITAVSRVVGCVPPVSFGRITPPLGTGSITVGYQCVTDAPTSHIAVCSDGKTEVQLFAEICWTEIAPSPNTSNGRTKGPLPQSTAGYGHVMLGQRGSTTLACHSVEFSCLRDSE